jgi:hypothetical protein
MRRLQLRRSPLLLHEIGHGRRREMDFDGERRGGGECGRMLRLRERLRLRVAGRGCGGPPKFVREKLGPAAAAPRVSLQQTSQQVHEER